MLLTSCSEYKYIPEETLQAIITESLISEAIASNKSRTMTMNERTEFDSLDIYKPILRKHEYTIGDFKYTIQTLAMRKSKPLDNIFANVLLDIEARDAKAAALYAQLLEYDSLCIQRYTDTLYTKDTTIRGSLSKFKLPEIKEIKLGKYTLQFKYTTMEDYRVGTKSVNYEAKSSRYPRKSSTMWLNRGQKEMELKIEIEIDKPYDTIIWKFIEPRIDANLNLKDTSHIRNINLIYQPPINKMRLDYMYEKTGLIPSIKEYYETKFSDLSDSITIPFIRTIPTDSQRRN